MTLSAMTEACPLDVRRYRLHALLGDWDDLASLHSVDLSTHPDRIELATLAILGCHQLIRGEQTKDLVDLALQWGCPREDLAAAMVASVHNTLGRACHSIGDDAGKLRHYRLAIQTAPGGVESDELAQARAAHQARLFAAEHPGPQPSGTATAEAEVVQMPGSSIVSYAQNFEDVMLWRALGRTAAGFYIDLGAQDPIVDSVSRAFYEKGWRGIHVEPTPTYAQQLREDRPDESVIQAAISGRDGVLKFFEIPETGISTGDADIASQHQARGFPVHEIEVACIPVDQVFAMAEGRDIHWLKIDVEGMERDVVQSWHSDIRPWVVVVESTLPLTQVESDVSWRDELEAKGYRHAYFDGLNRFFVSEQHLDLMAAFRSGPNVFDGFTLSGTSTSTFHRVPLPA